jgi:hypothetical protein
MKEYVLTLMKKSFLIREFTKFSECLVLNMEPLPFEISRVYSSDDVEQLFSQLRLLCRVQGSHGRNQEAKAMPGKTVRGIGAALMLEESTQRLGGAGKNFKLHTLKKTAKDLRTWNDPNYRKEGKLYNQSKWHKAQNVRLIDNTASSVISQSIRSYFNK